MIETKHFRLLHAIDEHGSVSGAARALGYSQSAITQQLQGLEKLVATVLLVRSRSGARLTEAGEIMLNHGRTVLDATSLAESELAAIAGLRSGHVRLTSFSTAAATLVPATISRMANSNPGISFSLIEAEPPQALEILRRGGTDIAIISRYSTEEETAMGDLLTIPLMEEDMHVVLHRSHPLTSERIVSIRDLADAKWIAGCPNCRGHLVSACAQAGFTPDIMFETDDYVTLQSLAARGVGVALLPDLALTAVQVEGLTFRKASPRFTRTVSAAITRDMAKVGAVHEAIRALQASAAEIARNSTRIYR